MANFVLQFSSVQSLSRVRLSATPWTAAYQAPPSMGFSRQEYWSGMPLPSPYVLQLYSFICRWTSRLLPCPIYCNSATVNIGAALSFTIMVSSGYMPSSGIIGSSVQFSSITQSCLTLCDPMNHTARQAPCLSPTPRVHSYSRPSSQ